MSNSFRPSTLIKPDPVYEYGYPVPGNRISSPLAYNPVSNSPGYSYTRFGDESDNINYSTQDVGWDHGDFVEHKKKRPYMIRWKSGKKVDKRLMMVLESFYQEIYVKRQDFFKKIFPDRMQEDFDDVFRKVDAMLNKNKSEVRNQTLQRSLSMGSPRRMQRFKIKTPAVVVGNSDGQSGGASDSDGQNGYGK
ncbi:OLC1v1026249C1 [Oldenlandia corymbosa var. corymbosa]|uniref:OLC1v1026249C1 n=1 Tax=Oldenlandia corymbosa var. corymbosa TaxID=529605 RepID=A0AAV1C6L7_OLDCO|nr:OLC1v1026249C1 [Oldenlandia corymbosa var. corymbosa]